MEALTGQIDAQNARAGPPVTHVGNLHHLRPVKKDMSRNTQ